jgi:D-serine deaminase-like pyridoxal phosphate-dependent protein
MLRADVPTPALLLDLDALDRNIARMAETAAAAGVALRPHAKSHKCIEIAQRVVRAGAIGVSCATIGEAEAMALGGLTGILVTAPLTSRDALDRLSRLLRKRANILVVADDPRLIPVLADIAKAAETDLPIIVDIDVGVGRTGCVEIADAVALASLVDKQPGLLFAGVQAYWGNLQQIMPFADRAARVGFQADRLRQAVHALHEVNLPAAIVTGGGTGTHEIDAATGLFTELQPGSYMFLDSCYGAITTSEKDNPFEPSLFVASSVVSSIRQGRIIVNAGFKAFATDSGVPTALRGAPEGCTFRFMGDEHGALDFATGAPPMPGSTVEFLTSHCDPTVNLYSAIHVVRGDDVVDIWAVRARY